MNILVKLGRSDHQYDIHSLVKSFFPYDEVRVISPEDDQGQEEPQLVIELDFDETKDRKRQRDELKKSLYTALSDYTGRELPWGVLSGIRPVKLPMAEIRGGRSAKEAADILMRDYLVSREKADLAAEVAENEIRALEGIDIGPDSYSVYVNIPFCPSICLYCTFSSNSVGLFEDQLDRYLDELASEMRERKLDLEARGITRGPDTVYVGGGTPTALDPARFERLLDMIGEMWDTGGASEYTVECGRPDSITDDHLRILKEHGVTRISVNPQTMNAKTLERIGRRHTPEDTVRVFEKARSWGFDNINMDIILGLPGEGPDELRVTLEEIMKLRPDSLTVHSLAVKRASRLRLNIIEDRAKDPSADRGTFGELRMTAGGDEMRFASECARGMGMLPYYLYRQKNIAGNLENTGFALPGKEGLYNILIMEELETIYAFGAGASTKYVMDDGRIERTVSPKDLKTWFARRAEAGA